jgi:hypothetical protein
MDGAGIKPFDPASIPPLADETDTRSTMPVSPAVTQTRSPGFSSRRIIGSVC